MIRQNARVWNEDRSRALILQVTVEGESVELVGVRPIVVAPRAAALVAGRRRDQVEHEATETDEPARPGLAARAWSYAKAEAHLVAHGPAGADVVAHRRACCSGLDVELREVSPACRFFRRDDGDRGVDGFCEACGCPEWRRARMAVKWTMQLAACPREHYR